MNGEQSIGFDRECQNLSRTGQKIQQVTTKAVIYKVSVQSYI